MAITVAVPNIRTGPVHNGQNFHNVVLIAENLVHVMIENRISELISGEGEDAGPSFQLSTNPLFADREILPGERTLPRQTRSPNVPLSHKNHPPLCRQ